MRILHYKKGFSHLSETFIYDYVTELECQGIDNYFLTFNRLNEKERPFKKVIEMPFPGRWNIEKQARKVIKLLQGEDLTNCRWPQMRRRIKKVMFKIKPDVVHAHMGNQGVVIAQAARELGIPLIVSFHGNDAFKLTKDEFWKKKYRTMGENVFCITCVSNYMKKHLSKFFEGLNIKEIHVGKNLEDYTYSKHKDKINHWISIGRLTEKKGHEDTIKAFHKILKKNPDQRLKIIGGGELEKKLFNLVKELNISNKVALVGALPHSDAKKELKRADAFILSSKTAVDGDKEGIPTVLMEAQAMGLPCVSTKHSGIPEVFPQENQFLLAEEGNVEEIFRKIERLINLPLNEVRKLSKRARKKIEQEFNLKIESQKLISLYQASVENK